MPVRDFQLLIKPVGGRCNLRCAYCFYAGTDELLESGPCAARRAPPTMPDSVLESLIREFLSYRLRESVFCWQGGEPTLAGLDFFRRAVGLQKSHGADGQVIGNAFQTNGILVDRDWASLFAEYKFLVGLSLDGPRDVHERYRGQSFDAALAAAQLFRQFRVEFNILCVVSQANVHRGAEVYGWFVDRGFLHLQFIPCVERRPDGSLTPHSITGDEFGEFLVAVFNEWWPRDVHRVRERNFDSLISCHARGRPNLCTYQETCGAYLLVERGGEVFPCDFFARPEWLLGHVGERPLVEFVDRVREERFGKLKLNAPPACRGCEWWAQCHGGCPRDRAPDGRSHLCAGYRRFFSAASVRLAQLAASVRDL